MESQQSSTFYGRKPRSAEGDNAAVAEEEYNNSTEKIGKRTSSRSPRRKNPALPADMTLAEMEQLDEAEDLVDRPFSGIGPHNAEQVRRMEIISKRASGAFHNNLSMETPLNFGSQLSIEDFKQSEPVVVVVRTPGTTDLSGESADIHPPGTEEFHGERELEQEYLEEQEQQSTGEEPHHQPQQQPHVQEQGAAASLKGGSLLRMFESTAFDAYLHMYYLYKRLEPGVQQYLVNMLYTKRSDADIHFYLPQLCCLSVDRCRTSDLHRFLLTRASKAMHIAVKVSWLFQSFADGTSPERDSNSQGLTQEVEMACVNSTPFPPGTSAALQRDDHEQAVPDLFERRKIITKLQRSTDRQNFILQQQLLQQQQQQQLHYPHASFSSTSPGSPARTALSDEGHHKYLRTPDGDSLEVPLAVGHEEAESYSSSRHHTPVSSGRSIGQTQLKHRVRRGFVRTTAETTLAGSKIKLPSPYVKLGTPWSYSAFKDASLMDEELQPFIVKQRRCDYFNLLNTLSMMLSEASNLLSMEPDKALRLPLLQGFLDSLNEWMCCRRCVVAASEGIFAMTGLNIPLFEFGSLLPTGSVPHSTQIVRFLPQECKVLSSKKRAPFLLVYEVADLDEDLRRLPEFFRLSTADFEKRSGGHAAWDHLYVYRCILEELKQRGLYRPSDNLNDSPLTELQAALLPNCDRRGGKESGKPVQDTPTIEEDEDEPHDDEEDPVVILESQTLAPPMPASPSEENTSDGPSRDASATSEMLCADFVLPQGRRKQQHSRSKASKSSNGKSSYGAWTSVLGLGGGGGGGKHNTTAVTGLGEENGKRRGSSRPKANASELAANARTLRQQLWGKTWAEKKARYRQHSPYGSLKSWNMACVLVKGGDDLRQEMLASQLIRQFKLIFDAAGLPLYLRPYEILVTGHSCGIMVFVPDTVSVDSLKKTYGTDSVADVFDAAFADNPYEAKKNFIQSHAAYSIIGYLLQVKDRHNGNYLLDCEGHIIHIDYGFMLSNCPGYFGWESSPFKLTTEFLDVMDGEFSDNYDYFRTLVVRGFLEARKHVDKFALLIEMMMSAHRMPCFTAGPDVTVAAFRERFLCHLTEQSCVNKIVDMIDISVNNWRSVHYDNFQRITNGII